MAFLVAIAYIAAGLDEVLVDAWYREYNLPTAS